MRDFIVSVSGVRGKIGETLGPEVLTRFAAAFGTFVGGKTVVIGRDTRTSGLMARHAVLAGLVASGCKVIDVGICPTPTALFTSKTLNAQGSLVITASHNPIDWNGLEFAAESGRLLNQAEQAQLMHIYESEDFRLARWYEQGTVEAFDAAIDRHIANILSCDWIDLNQTRSHRLKVVIDCCNGAGCVISPRLLSELGCRVIELNCVPDGNFPHATEPTPDALNQLCQVVQSEGADIGFAHDVDADRLVVVTDGGFPLSSEYTFALAAEFLLSKRKGDIVATVSTSRMLDDIADRHGVEIHRTAVGVGFVVEKMRATKAIIGGEGTGGVIYPEVQYTTDGIASIAAIVQLLADSIVSAISELVTAMPRYAISKKKLEVSSQEIADTVMKLAHETYRDEQVAWVNQEPSLDLTDGVKRVWKDRWVNIRKSGTEPVIRVFSEALTSEQAEVLCDSTLKTLRDLMTSSN